MIARCASVEHNKRDLHAPCVSMGKAKQKKGKQAGVRVSVLACFGLGTPFSFELEFENSSALSPQLAMYLSIYYLFVAAASVAPSSLPAPGFFFLYFFPEFKEKKRCQCERECARQISP